MPRGSWRFYVYFNFWKKNVDKSKSIFTFYFNQWSYKPYWYGCIHKSFSTKPATRLSTFIHHHFCVLAPVLIAPLIFPIMKFLLETSFQFPIRNWKLSSGINVSLQHWGYVRKILGKRIVFREGEQKLISTTSKDLVQ